MSPILQKAMDRQRHALDELSTALVGAQNALSYLRNAKRKLDSVVRADTIAELKGVFESAVREGRWPAECEVTLAQSPALYPGESDQSFVTVDGHYIGGETMLALPREFTEEMTRILRVAMDTAQGLLSYVDGTEDIKLTP